MNLILTALDYESTVTLVRTRKAIFSTVVPTRWRTSDQPLPLCCNFFESCGWFKDSRPAKVDQLVASVWIPESDVRGIGHGELLL